MPERGWGIETLQADGDMGRRPVELGLHLAARVLRGCEFRDGTAQEDAGKLRGFGVIWSSE